MSSYRLLRVPVEVPDLGVAGHIVCDWEKGDTYRAGFVVPARGDTSRWVEDRTYNRLSFALRYCAKLALRGERTGR